MIDIKVFKNAQEACEELANRLAELAKKGGTVALSGGSTPKLLFKIMRTRGSHPWKGLLFFWGDERLVPAESAESNYGEFYRELVKTGIIASEAVFESTYAAAKEVILHTTERKIENHVPYVFGLPCFNLILLGIGEDGHTASLFPNNLSSFNATYPLELTVHPLSRQPRISLTGSTLNNAQEIIILCTGESKRNILHKILIEKDLTLPASLISPINGTLGWYLDEASAKEIIK